MVVFSKEGAEMKRTLWIALIVVTSFVVAVVSYTLISDSSEYEKIEGEIAILNPDYEAFDESYIHIALENVDLLEFLISVPEYDLAFGLKPGDDVMIYYDCTNPIESVSATIKAGESRTFFGPNDKITRLCWVLDLIPTE